MRLLIAEDDAKAASLLVQGLKAEGYAVDHAADGDEVIWLAETYTYDAMVLDVMMPAKDGFSVVRHLRRKGVFAPVIFVTARGEVEDRIRGLDAGGDDYIVKPFSLAELLARLRAILRRQRPGALNVLRVGDLELDLITHKANRAGREIDLTNREFALLEFLVVNSPRPVSKMAIVEHVWDQHFDSQTNVVNVYINYLRNKIDLPGMKPLLHTIRGVGFAVSEEP